MTLPVDEAWIPVDTFSSPEEAATAVAAQQTGVIEWDRLSDVAERQSMGLEAWTEHVVDRLPDPAPWASAEFKAAWRRLTRRAA